MARTSLPACAAGVLLLHGVLAWTLLHPSSSGEGIAATRAGHVVEIYLASRVSSVPPPPPAARIEKPPMPATRPRPTIDSPPKPVPAPAEGAAPDAATEGLAPVQAYRSPNELDRAALPRSSPDIDSLAGAAWSGLPLRLRLFIDATGTVVDVHVLRSSEDPELLNRLREMFLATGFIPGRLNGADVASFKDLELSLGDVR